MTTQKNRALFGILFLIFIFFIILMIFATYTMNIFKNESSTLDLGGKKDSIAVVEINEVIMESKKFIELLERAEEDKETRAIIMRINSPGGAVGPTQEIYEEIRRIDSMYDESEGKKGKPVYASFGSVAASGGYYVGAAARKIYSNPGTVTGSIGVIMQFMDVSKLYEWARVKPEPIKAGRYKDAGGGHRSLTNEERDLIGGMIGGVRQQFVNHILETRRKKIKGDIQEIAQGQILSGEEAFKVGLVDELAGLWTAGRRIHDELKLEGDFGLKFIKKKKKKGIWKVLDQLDESIANVNELFSKANNGLFNMTPMIMAKP